MKTTTIYIIGVPQTGGCWFSGSHDAFTSMDAAKAELERQRAQGMPYLRIFTVNIPEGR